LEEIQRVRFLLILCANPAIKDTFQLKISEAKMAGFNGGFKQSSFPRKMHKAVCADCKQDCEVPFEPIQGKPVYCRECYQKHRK
jgi:CxxC-x17-CxxC domain-containing protein